MQYFFVQMEIPKEESLFWKYCSSGPASFFEECLAQFRNRVQKKLLWDCFSFLCSVKVLPRFSKQLEKVPSFSWPCQPQRERIELERLSAPKHHNKIHKREDDPCILRYSVHDLHGEMDEEWTQHTLELEPVLKQLMSCTEGSKPGRDCVQG